MVHLVVRKALTARVWGHVSGTRSMYVCLNGWLGGGGLVYQGLPCTVCMMMTSLQFQRFSLYSIHNGGVFSECAPWHCSWNAQPTPLFNAMFCLACYVKRPVGRRAQTVGGFVKQFHVWVTTWDTRVRFVWHFAASCFTTKHELGAAASTQQLPCSYPPYWCTAARLSCHLGFGGEVGGLAPCCLFFITIVTFPLMVMGRSVYTLRTVLLSEHTCD